MLSPQMAKDTVEASAAKSAEQSRGVGDACHRQWGTSISHDHTIDAHVGVDTTIGFTSCGKCLVFCSGHSQTNKPNVVCSSWDGGRLEVVARTVVGLRHVVVVAGHGVRAARSDGVSSAVKTSFCVSARAVVRRGQSVVVASLSVGATRTGRSQAEEGSHTRCSVPHDGVAVCAAFEGTHIGVQRQLRLGNRRSICGVDHLRGRHVPPLPWSSVKRLCWSAVDVIVLHRV